MQGLPQIFYQALLEYKNTVPPQIIYTVPTNTSIIAEIFLYIQKSDNAGYDKETNKDDISLFILKNGEPTPTKRETRQLVGYRIDEQKEDRRFQNQHIANIYLNQGDRIYGQGFYCTTSICITGIQYTNSIINAQNSFYTSYIPNISAQQNAIASNLATIAGCICNPP